MTTGPLAQQPGGCVSKLGGEQLMGDVIALLTGLPNWSELLIVAIIGLLLFGKRLPDVARSMGKAVVEFKKGVKDIKNDVETGARVDTERRLDAPATPPLPSSPPEPVEPEVKSKPQESVNSGD